MNQNISHEKIQQVLNNIKKENLTEAELRLYKILNYRDEPEIIEKRQYAINRETNEKSKTNWFLYPSDTSNFYLSQCIEYFENKESISRN